MTDPGSLSKVILLALAAPLLAAAVAAALTFLTNRLVRGRSPERSQRNFRWAQIASSSLVALSHGPIDAQKTMGVITLTLFANGNLPTSVFEVPTWVISQGSPSRASVRWVAVGPARSPLASQQR